MNQEVEKNEGELGVKSNCTIHIQAIKWNRASAVRAGLIFPFAPSSRGQTHKA